MKKLLATLLASTMALTAIGGLVACGGGNGGGNGGNGGGAKELKPYEFSQVTHLDDPLLDKAGDSDDKVGACTITVWAPSIALETYQALGNEFTSTYRNGKYSNVTLEWDAQDEGNVKTLLGTDSTGGADVFFYAGDHTEEMIRNNWLLPLRGATGSYYSAAINQRDMATAADVVRKNGYYYAFPATNDNGYYLVYNTDDLTAEEADDMDKIMEKAAEKDKNFYWNYTEGFWGSIFFFGAGITPEWKGVDTDFSEYGGPKGEIGAKATIKYITDAKMTNSAGDGIVSAVLSGEMIAGICGTWENPTPAQLETGKIGCKKLPMFTVDGQKYQTGAFFGGKYCGVNPSSANTQVAMALANYLTNTAAQTKRFDEHQSGPSNKAVAELPAVKANVPLAAYNDTVAAGGVFQGDVPQKFWDGISAYNKNVYSGDITLSDLQLSTLVTDMTTQK
ncbi:MAG: extracellular solute-binding protein [Clostridiales bacterium]|nr:extracellular solute-binding protein [Clostridiales bacterium]